MIINVILYYYRVCINKIIKYDEKKDILLNNNNDDYDFFVYFE